MKTTPLKKIIKNSFIRFLIKIFRLSPIENKDVDSNSLKVKITSSGVSLDGTEQLIGHPIISKQAQAIQKMWNKK